MAKSKISDVLNSSKLMNGLLIVLVTSMLSVNSRLGAIEEQGKSINDIEKKVDRINDIQISRTDEIDCVNKIMGIMGCNFEGHNHE